MDIGNNVHKPRRLEEGQSPHAFELAEAASKGRLVVYTGAGLSIADPTGMPDGAEVARRCHARLVDVLGEHALDGANPLDLTSVADMTVGAVGSPDLMRRTAAAAAEYTWALPNFSHQILALLLLEGRLEVITTNWDDCIERASGDERVLAVISDQDRQEIRSAALLKVHGCATRPTSLLITTDELANPPAWARDAVNSRLSDSVVVFAGIGDVAGYVRKRIEEAAEAVGTRDAVFVVAPSIQDDWSESQWATILPELEERRRIASTSDEFLDELAAACLRLSLREIQEALEEEGELSAAFQRARDAVEERTSTQVLHWLRSCPVPRVPGTSVMEEQAFSIALVALGLLSEAGRLSFEDGSRVRVGEARYEVLIARGTVGATRLRREAVSRLVRVRSKGEVPEPPTFLVAGAVGRLDTTGDLPSDVLDEVEPDDVVGGALAVEPRFVRAEDVLA